HSPCRLVPRLRPRKCCASRTTTRRFAARSSIRRRSTRWKNATNKSAMTVRVGFLGAGLIATYHSKSLHVSGADVAWAGVFDPDSARAEDFAKASGATVSASEEEVLDGCDAVYVCTWTAEHPRLVDAAAARGLPVFCEKPMAINL